MSSFADSLLRGTDATGAVDCSRACAFSVDNDVRSFASAARYPGRKEDHHRDPFKYDKIFGCSDGRDVTDASSESTYTKTRNISNSWNMSTFMTDNVVRFFFFAEIPMWKLSTIIIGR